MAGVAALRERLVDCLGLKALPRTGWVRDGVPDAESVASHSWGVAWLVLALAPPELDRGTALAMAVLHDLPELRTGDRTPDDTTDAATRLVQETAALEEIVEPMPRPEELLSVWHAFSEQLTPEARFVRACDKLDLALQATAYERAHGLDLREFVDSALGQIDDETLRRLAGV